MDTECLCCAVGCECEEDEEDDVKRVDEVVRRSWRSYSRRCRASESTLYACWIWSTVYVSRDLGTEEGDEDDDVDLPLLDLGWGWGWGWGLGGVLGGSRGFLSGWCFRRAL